MHPPPSHLDPRLRATGRDKAHKDPPAAADSSHISRPTSLITQHAASTTNVNPTATGSVVVRAHTIPASPRSSTPSDGGPSGSEPGAGGHGHVQDTIIIIIIITQPIAIADGGAHPPSREPFATLGSDVVDATAVPAAAEADGYDADDEGAGDDADDGNYDDDDDNDNDNIIIESPPPSAPAPWPLPLAAHLHPSHFTPLGESSSSNSSSPLDRDTNPTHPPLTLSTTDTSSLRAWFDLPTETEIEIDADTDTEASTAPSRDHASRQRARQRRLAESVAIVQQQLEELSAGEYDELLGLDTEGGERKKRKRKRRRGGGGGTESESESESESTEESGREESVWDDDDDVDVDGDWDEEGSWPAGLEDPRNWSEMF